MSDMSTKKATIMVKKADGTAVSMSLEEFRKMQAEKKTEPIAEPSPMAEWHGDVAPTVLSPQTPVKPTKNLPPLEPITKSSALPTTTPAQSMDEWQGARGTGSGSKPAPTVQVKKTVSAQTLQPMAPVQIRDPRPVAAPVVMATANDFRSPLEEVETLPQAIQTPVSNAPKHAFPLERVDSMRDVPWSPRGVAQAPIQPNSVQIPKDQRTGKPVVQDVVKPVVSKQTVGPVEELRWFDLSDLHKLGHNSDEWVGMLKKKFLAIQQESYLMFMEAVEAWFQSPLYTQYVTLVRDSLAQGRPLAALMQSDTPGQLTLPDVQTIVAINTMIRA